MRLGFYILFLLLLCSQEINAQGVLPIHRYINNQVWPFDVVTVRPSFGYSLRKLTTSYTGFSVRVRRNNDNAEANIAFDSIGIVSNNSIATIVAIGSSSFTIGQTMTLSAFKGTNQFFVRTWYNQGNPIFDAIQTANNANQPELVMNSAGTGNTKPSILFDGTDFLRIPQPIDSIVANGIRGSFLIAIKPTANSAQFTFGFRSVTPPLNDWRWTFHINWSDGNFYFDAAEVCCAANRAFFNGGNLNLWKQYSIIRGTSYKTIRVSGVATSLNNSSAGSTANSGGEFQIGSSFNNPNGLYQGNMSELLMYPVDLNLDQIDRVERNQIIFWNL